MHHFSEVGPIRFDKGFVVDHGPGLMRQGQMMWDPCSRALESNGHAGAMTFPFGSTGLVGFQAKGKSSGSVANGSRWGLVAEVGIVQDRGQNDHWNLPMIRQMTGQGKGWIVPFSEDDCRKVQDKGVFAG